MTNEIQTYQIPVAEASKAIALLDQHLASDPKREFRLKDFTSIAKFSVTYFFDAMQSIFDKTMLGQDQISVVLPSGWTARSIDIGHIWKRHIEFISPTDPNSGFVLQGELDMLEAVAETAADEDFSSAAFLEKIFSEMNSKEALVKNNTVSDQYRPENAVRIDEYAAYPFGSLDKWYGCSRDDVLKSLLKSKFVGETFEYRPQGRIEGSPLQVDHGPRSITEPGQAFDTLRIISELVFMLDPEAAENALSKQLDANYVTLFPEDISIFTAVRATFSETEPHPSPSFDALVAYLWTKGVCEDVMRNLHFVTESAQALVSMGHTNSENAFDCNDGRTNAYAHSSEECTTIVTEWEDWSTAIQFSDDRVKVSKCDFETGRLMETVVDFEYCNGRASRLNEIARYDDSTASVLIRSLVDLSSVHCYVVDDGNEDNNNPSPQP